MILSSFSVAIIVFFVIMHLFALFLLIIWFNIPNYYRKVYSKGFDGSYTPEEDDYSQLIGDMNYGTQYNSFLVEIDKISGLYQINFGEGRSLTNGKVIVQYNGTRYSSQPEVIQTGSKKEGGYQLIQEEQLKLSAFSEDTRETSIGTAKELRMLWLIPNTTIQFSTTILWFLKNDYLVFETHIPNASQTMDKLTAAPIGPINLLFPVFQNHSPNQRVFTFRDGVFCPPRRKITYAHTPVAWFDDDKNAILMSAMDHFLTTAVNQREKQIEWGINGEINQLNPGYRHSIILVAHKGINAIFQYWGELLHKWHQIQPKGRDLDLITTNLGFFTDNGAHYYYNPMKGQKFDKTLLNIKNYADKQNIPYQFYHLDSWWYQKTSPRWKQKVFGGIANLLGGWMYGGALLWEPDPNFFDSSLKELAEKLGKPFTAHNRWYDDPTPYADRFHFIKENGWAMPADERYWEHIMHYCVENGIILYEQDWMVNQWRKFTHLRSSVDAAETWLRDMGEKAENHKITVQYCMETPSMVMFSIFLPAVTHVRCCDDYGDFKPHNYDIPFFMQSSILARAMGVAPFKDTFKTSRRGRIHGETRPDLMCLVATLSTGPVTPGDEIGFENRDIIMASCRSDGRILKPDRPMTAVDLTFIKNDRYYICQTEQTHGQWQWFYILTINLWPQRVKRNDYTLQELEIVGDFVEYDWFSKEVKKVHSTTKIYQQLKFEDFKYRIYAPIFQIGQNEVALIGDTSKYAPMNDLTFSKIAQISNELHMDISGIRNDVITISFYTQNDPTRILWGDKPVLFSRQSQWLISVSLTFQQEEVNELQIHW